MSEEPRRWLDDGSVSEELRADLLAVRDAPTPPVDHAAGLTALEARIRDAGPGSHGGGPGGAAGAPGFLAAAVAALCVLGAGAWWLTTRGHEDPSTTAADRALPAEVAPRESVDARRADHATAGPATDTAESPARPAPDVQAGVEADVRDPWAHALEAPAVAGHEEGASATAASNASAEGGEEPAATPTVRPRHGDRATGAPSAAPEAPTMDLLRREMELLEEARLALGSDPRRALALVDDAQREVGRGTFGDERDAIRVLALFALHRETEARPLAARLLARNPDGLYAARIRAAMEEGPR